MQSNTVLLNNVAKTTYSTSFPSFPKRKVFQSGCEVNKSKRKILEETLILSSSSLSTCDVEVIESLFSMRESITLKPEHQTITIPYNNDFNSICGKRKRCDSVEVPSRKLSKESLLETYLEKAKHFLHLSENQVYSKLFKRFHEIRTDVLNFIASNKENGCSLLSLCKNSQPIKTNLIRMIFAVYSEEQSEQDLSVRFGRFLARYPVLALVVSTMKPFRAISSNDMTRLAESIGLQESNKFKQVLKEKLGFAPEKNMIQEFAARNKATDQHQEQPTHDDDTLSYCNWLLNLTNPVEIIH